MKFIFLIITISLLLKTFLSITNKEKTQKSAKAEYQEDAQSTPSDAVYKRIVGYIYSIAEDSMKSSDLLKKKKLSGSLPEGYPASTRRLALKTRDDIAKWRKTLGLPTDLYRVCVYSNSAINYSKWCNNNFFGSRNKRDSILYLNFYFYDYLNNFILFLTIIFIIFFKIRLLV